MFIIGALLSRLHGADLFPYKVVKSLIWATPFAFVTGLYLGWWAFLVLGVCAMGKSTGHGQYFSLGRWKKSLTAEKLDPIVDFFFGTDPRTIYADLTALDNALNRYGEDHLYWRCVFGLSLKGFASTLGFTIAMLFVNPWWALASAVGGVLMPLGYLHRSETGEFISGALAYLILDYIICSLI